MSEPKSMGKFHPSLLNDWDYVNNTDIDPMRVSTSSTEVVHWVCAKCGRRWEASISVPVENDDEVIGNTLGEEKLIVHAVAALYNLISDLRPNWLDNEDTSLTLDISIDGRKAQSCGGLVAMKEEGFTFGLED